MSLVKAIKHGKEHRKPYRGSKAFDYSCTNHGTCKYCANNRQHAKHRDDKAAKDAIKEYLNKG